MHWPGGARTNRSINAFINSSFYRGYGSLSRSVRETALVRQRCVGAQGCSRLPSQLSESLFLTARNGLTPIAGATKTCSWLSAVNLRATLNCGVCNEHDTTTQVERNANRSRTNGRRYRPKRPRSRICKRPSYAGRVRRLRVPALWTSLSNRKGNPAAPWGRVALRIPTLSFA